MRKKQQKNGGVKLHMTKRHTRARSSDQHRLLLLTEVKSKEYHHYLCVIITLSPKQEK